MRALPDLNDVQAMAATGRRSVLMKARNEACEALRDACTACQSADVHEAGPPAEKGHRSGAAADRGRRPMELREMTVIEASSVRCQTMADSTLRLTIDIEPRHANDAFQLFGKAGTPLALAALKPARTEKPAARQPGYSCLRAVQLCQNPKFWEWIRIASLQGKTPKSEEDAAKVVREVCGIESRNELDDDLEARATFGKKLEQPFVAWLAKQGQPA